jgi:hypothetical protein
MQVRSLVDFAFGTKVTSRAPPSREVVVVVRGRFRLRPGEPLAPIDHGSSLCQRVSDLLSVHAGEAHTVVSGTQLTQAHTAAILTEGTVTINGKEVHLG